MALVPDPDVVPDRRIVAWSAEFLAAVRADGHAEWRRELADRVDVDAELRRLEDATIALVAAIVDDLDPSALVAAIIKSLDLPLDFPDDLAGYVREVLGRKRSVSRVEEFLARQVYPTTGSTARYVVRFHSERFEGACVLLDSREDFDLVSLHRAYGYRSVEVRLRSAHRPRRGEFGAWERDLRRRFPLQCGEDIEVDVSRSETGMVLDVREP